MARLTLDRDGEAAFRQLALDGSVRQAAFATLQKPMPEKTAGLLGQPGPALAMGFGAGLPYGALRTDRFEGPALAALEMVDLTATASTTVATR